MTEQTDTKIQGGLTEAQKRENVIRLAFHGSEERFEEFCRTIREEIPEGTRVILRGSAVTGARWTDGAPFDADGPGTSDLDVTLVGDEVIGFFKVTGFFVPGMHSRPGSSSTSASCRTGCAPWSGSAAGRSAGGRYRPFSTPATSTRFATGSRISSGARFPPGIPTSGSITCSCREASSPRSGPVKS